MKYYLWKCDGCGVENTREAKGHAGGAKPPGWIALIVYQEEADDPKRRLARSMHYCAHCSPKQGRVKQIVPALPERKLARTRSR